MLPNRQRQQLKKAIEQAFDCSNGFDIQEVEGFLYGLVITPKPIPPEEWLPATCGDLPPRFKTAKVAELFYDQILQAYNAFNRLRLDGTLHFPWQIEHLTEDSFFELLNWVVGFDRALALRLDFWQADEDINFSDDELSLEDCMSVIFSLANPEELLQQVERHSGDFDHDEFMAEMIPLVPLAVQTLQEYAEEQGPQHEAETTVSPQSPRRTEKIGRNEPCPCGSGKKYKKCCLKKEESPPNAGAADNLIEFPSRQPSSVAAQPVMKEKEKALLSKIVKKTAGGFHRKRPGYLNDREEEFFFTNAAVPFGLIEILAGLTEEDESDELTLEAVLFLLSPLLEEMRSSIERGRKGAGERLELFQRHIAVTLLCSDVNLAIGTEVVHALRESRLELLPVLKEAHEKRLEELAESHPKIGEFPDLSVLNQMFMEAGCEDAYDRFDFIIEQLHLIQPEEQLALLQAFADSDFPLLRAVAAMAVLHPDREVREQVPALLWKSENTIDPESLRRLILLRNWLPAEGRSDLDRCIQRARKAGVECVALQGGDVETVYATPIDGVGAQAFWIITKVASRHRMDCLIWKQTEGIIDAWGRQMPKAEIEKLVRSARKDTGIARVSDEYLDQIVCHALNVGLASGRVPPVKLLGLAEMLGISEWRPVPFDFEEKIRFLYSEAKAQSRPIFTHRTVAKVLNESRQWLEVKKFGETWFEDDATVFEHLQKALGRPRQWVKKYPQAIDIILNEIIGPKRQVWLERLVFMTMWLQANTGRPPLGWHKMLVMADYLLQELPLHDNPLFVSVAERTLYAAIERGE